MRSLLSGATIFGLMAAIFCFAYAIQDQPATVDFLVPHGTSIDAVNEEIIFKTAAGKTWLDASCGAPESGEYAVQNVAAVLKGGTDPIRLFGVAVLEEIQAETRVGDLTLLGTCTVGSTLYHRFRGAVR